jgi:hypothetical protein
MNIKMQAPYKAALPDLDRDKKLIRPALNQKTGMGDPSIPISSVIGESYGKRLLDREGRCH